MNQSVVEREVPPADPSIDVGDQLLKEAQVEWVSWPDKPGLHWCKPEPGYEPTVVLFVLCCGVLQLQAFGRKWSDAFPEDATKPGGTLEGYRFTKLDVPPHIR